MIHYTITVDTEEEWDWNGPFPVKDLSTENIAGLGDFQALCDRHNARPTYFVNHAVLENSASRQQICRLHEHASTEIGLHIHPWNTPPIVSDVVATEDSFIHNLDPGLIKQKLEMTYDQFQQCGMAPVSYRGGRYSSGPVVHEFLKSRNFRVDASPCPFSTWTDLGAPDYRSRDLTACTIAKCADGGKLWEVPLTRAFSRRPWSLWRSFFNTVENTPLRHFRLIGIAEKLNIVRRLWLNFECETLDRLEQFVGLAERWRLPHICFTVHSSSLAVGPGPYCRTASDRKRIFETIDRVLARLDASPMFQAATMRELPALLEETAT